MPGASARLSLLFSCLGHTYMHVFTAFYFVIVLALEVDWGLPYHELIELWTLGALLVGLGALPAGWLADRWSTSGMMTVYFLGLGAASMLCAFLDTPAALLAGLAAIGLFSSIYHPVGIAWVVRTARRRGKALGINGLFGGLGVAAAGLLAGTLIDLHGWRAAFFVPGAVCFATGLALAACARLGWVTESSVVHKPHAPAERADMWRAFAVLLLTMLCLGLIFQATQMTLPKVFDLRLRDIAGDGVFGIGVIVAGVYTVGGLVQVLGGHLADRYPLKPIYLAGFLIQIPVLIGVASLAGLPLIAMAVLTVVLASGTLPAENMLLARYAPERHHSLAFGVKFVIAFGSAPLALQVVSLVKAQTGEFFWLFGLLAALALVAASAAFLLPAAPRQAVAAAAE